MTVHTSLAHEIEEILSEPGRTRGACQRQLIVAARIVSRAPAGGTTAATVVGVLGRDDPDALRMVVRDICDEFGLDATVGLQLGSFSVRFFRPSNTEPA